MLLFLARYLRQQTSCVQEQPDYEDRKRTKAND